MSKFNDFLLLNRKERVVLYVLLCFAVLFIILNWALFNNAKPHSNPISLEDVIERKYYYSKKYKSKAKTFKKAYQQSVKNKKYVTDNFKASKSYIPKDYTQSEKKVTLPKQRYHLSFFDPNIVTLEELQFMRLPEFWGERLIKFRNKGAIFKKPTDLKKIYGTTDQLYHEIEPFIKIDEKTIPQEEEEEEEVKPAMVTLETEVVLVEINAAGEEDLDKLKGIGPAYAKRIARYRDYLGGYHSLDQLDEVYGLPPETLTLLKKQVKVVPSLILLNLNSATKEQLAKHPYISKKKAKIITNYIRNNGPFNEVSDLKKTRVFSQAEMEILLPYLTI